MPHQRNLHRNKLVRLVTQMKSGKKVKTLASIPTTSYPKDANEKETGAEKQLLMFRRCPQIVATKVGERVGGCKTLGRGGIDCFSRCGSQMYLTTAQSRALKVFEVIGFEPWRPFFDKNACFLNGTLRFL